MQFHATCCAILCELIPCDFVRFSASPCDLSCGQCQHTPASTVLHGCDVLFVDCCLLIVVCCLLIVVVVC